ncbi:unnamed protein product [Soboliphyme baturini]|uniref:Secreted protein n=1 Tax=Soboliphyme baturini TaxID=241478 RepID=A0A183J9B5_9BILA|nr:unnamed protein product [Soboliphyme baturini]
MVFVSVFYWKVSVVLVFIFAKSFAFSIRYVFEPGGFIFRFRSQMLLSSKLQCGYFAGTRLLLGFHYSRLLLLRLRSKAISIACGHLSCF